MDKIVDRFYIQEFLGYFFPGVISTMGIYLIIRSTLIGKTLSFSTTDLTTTFLLLVFSYVVGFIVSGLSKSLVGRLWKSRTTDELRNMISKMELENELISAYKSVFGTEYLTPARWSSTMFYMCRSMVQHHMPNAAHIAHRLNTLRQLRRNLIVPILIWLLAGCCWGISLLLQGNLLWGILLLPLSLLLSFVSIRTLIQGMIGSTEREIREVYTAFLAGYKSDLFGSPSKLLADKSNVPNGESSPDIKHLKDHEIAGSLQPIVHQLNSYAGLIQTTIKTINIEQENNRRKDKFLTKHLEEINQAAGNLLALSENLTTL